MRVIGIAGGIGSGKSRILRILEEEYQAFVIQTDQVAKDLEAKGQEGYEKILEAFGMEVLAADGQLDNKKLADLIFSDPGALERINGIIHPMVWKKVRQLASRSDAPLIVVESALFDKNPDDIYDEIWYVYTLREIRIQRLMENRGYSREKCLRMMASQPEEKAYRQLADRVIDNNGSMEEVRKQIHQIMSGANQQNRVRG